MRYLPWRSLSMEEAYQAIEWKVVFLIASMLPLGVAVEHTGAAQIGAEALIAVDGARQTRGSETSSYLTPGIETLCSSLIHGPSCFRITSSSQFRIRELE